ncbi:hypothetical protein [Candidatus Solirubrobacter pratensis]|uniref:hypothetical protein n=1 Tax=Candidatus Solirubrobacter pratensis TaxID=1298857 RepID=UPI00048158DF|nr:hypothetical protein [Candidatus Solirubrobacter pratensis]
MRATERHTAGAPLLTEALNAFQPEADLSPDDARWLWLACLIALFMLSDGDEADELYVEAIRRLGRTHASFSTASAPA